MFGGGHPSRRSATPTRTSTRGAARRCRTCSTSPTDFPKADGSPADRLPLFTNFRSGARILHAADTIIAPLPADQRPDPDKRLVPFGPPTARARSRSRRTATSCTEARAIADRIVALHASGSSWSEIARAVPHLAAVLPAAADVRRAGASRPRSSGSPACCAPPEVVEVMAYARAANDPMASVALARILHRPPLPRRVQGPRARRRLGQGQELRLARGRRRRRGDAVPVRRGARAPRRGRGALRRGTRAARGVPRRALGAARRGAPPGAGVPRRGDPAHRHRRRARGRRRPRRGGATLAQPGRVPRPGARVRTGRGRAHAPRVPRLRRRGRGTREGGMGARAAQRIRLGQGDDDPPGQGARVRPRLRAGRRCRA